jgi:hypothetical protein
MPNLREIFVEISTEQSANPQKNAFDTVRHKYLSALQSHTGRNIIAYYSGWLNGHPDPNVAINDRDKPAFMLAVNDLDRSLGLDLILHTPGGDVAATESLIEYLFSVFEGNIRAIVPQLSMSGGTMLALASRQVVMGKQSNLGPIDPQINGCAAQAVLDEFELAKADIKRNPHSVVLWQTNISKYPPTMLIACKQAMDWSKDIAKSALARNMCRQRPQDIGKILDTFADHSRQKAHNRHIPPSECIAAGLDVVMMEDDQVFQDTILSLHHCYHLVLQHHSIVKLVENQKLITYSEQSAASIQMAMQQQSKP